MLLAAMDIDAIVDFRRRFAAADIRCRYADCLRLPMLPMPLPLIRCRYAAADIAAAAAAADIHFF